jgi:hypothetical protein
MFYLFTGWVLLAIWDTCIYKRREEINPFPKCSASMKLIADRLLLSRACFLLGFTIVKLNKNKMKKVLKTVGLQHRRDYLSVEKRTRDRQK